MRQQKVFSDLALDDPDDLCLQVLDVHFGPDLPLKIGQHLDLEKVQVMPQIMNLQELMENETSIALAMIDPDAPSRKEPIAR